MSAVKMPMPMTNTEEFCDSIMEIQRAIKPVRMSLRKCQTPNAQRALQNASDLLRESIDNIIDGADSASLKEFVKRIAWRL